VFPGRFTYELGIEFELEKITDILKIIEYGVMATPALAVNGQGEAGGQGGISGRDPRAAALDRQGAMIS
jgi:hypothetical protein